MKYKVLFIFETKYKYNKNIYIKSIFKSNFSSHFKAKSMILLLAWHYGVFACGFWKENSFNFASLISLCLIFSNHFFKPHT